MPGFDALKQAPFVAAVAVDRDTNGQFELLTLQDQRLVYWQPDAQGNWQRQPEVPLDPWVGPLSCPLSKLRCRWRRRARRDRHHAARLGGTGRRVGTASMSHRPAAGDLADHDGATPRGPVLSVAVPVCPRSCGDRAPVASPSCAPVQRQGGSCRTDAVESVGHWRAGRSASGKSLDFISDTAQRQRSGPESAAGDGGHAGRREWISCG